MSSPLSALKGRFILLVEDDYFIAKQVQRRFALEGAIILGPVSNVPDALALAQTAPRIDGAVLDVNLQGEMVFPVADVLTDRGVRFVFATGYDATEIPARHSDVRHCNKPIDLVNLTDVLFG